MCNHDNQAVFGNLFQNFHNLYAGFTVQRTGWLIREETVLRDGKFLYTVMEVVYGPRLELTAGGCHFPPALLKNPTPELPVQALEELENLPQELNWLKEEN